MSNKDKDFNEFIEAFKKACKNMDSKYFSVKFADDQRNKNYYKERVYAYELYHNLRNLLDNEKYTLAGEMDKGGNLMFPKDLQGKIPDFIVHVPEINSWNLAVIEVKTTTSFNKGSGLVKDLKKITDFIEMQPHYFGGIELLFGDCEERKLSKKVADFLENKQCVSNATKNLIKNGRIKILLHCAPNTIPITFKV